MLTTVFYPSAWPISPKNDLYDYVRKKNLYPAQSATHLFTFKIKYAAIAKASTNTSRSTNFRRSTGAEQPKSCQMIQPKIYRLLIFLLIIQKINLFYKVFNNTPEKQFKIIKYKSL